MSLINKTMSWRNNCVARMSTQFVKRKCRLKNHSKCFWQRSRSFKKELDDYKNAKAIEVVHRAQDLRESRVKLEQEKSLTILSCCLCLWRSVFSICVATSSSWRSFDETLRQQKDFDFIRKKVLLTKNASEHWCIRSRMRSMLTNENIASSTLWRTRLTARTHSLLNRDLHEVYYEASR